MSQYTALDEREIFGSDKKIDCTVWWSLALHLLFRLWPRLSFPPSGPFPIHQCSLRIVSIKEHAVVAHQHHSMQGHLAITAKECMADYHKLIGRKLTRFFSETLSLSKYVPKTQYLIKMSTSEVYEVALGYDKLRTNLYAKLWDETSENTTECTRVLRAHQQTVARFSRGKMQYWSIIIY